MKLDRTRTVAMGVGAAALLTIGLAIGAGRSPAPRAPPPTPSAAGPACVTVVAEHAACALPPHRTAGQSAGSFGSSSVR